MEDVLLGGGVSEELPEIQPYFSQTNNSKALTQHVEKGRGILKQLLPQKFHAFSSEEMQKWIASEMPLVRWNALSNVPEALVVHVLVCPTQEVKAEKVLLDVIRKWLVPEKEVRVLGFYNMYFYMKQNRSRVFFLAEVEIFVENGRELGSIQKNLPLLSNELDLSLSSSKYLENILDMKALSLDQKSTQIQKYLRILSERIPGQFDVEIFRDMSAFFALSSPSFRKFRLPKHLTRIVVSQHLMRKKLHHHLSIYPEKRHLEYRFIRSQLHFPFGTKAVLGLSLALALSDQYELFEDNHVLAAVQTFLPNVHIVKGSYYASKANQDPIKYIYLELEKKNGERFSQQEIKLLRDELKEELKSRVERLIPSMFMIRNEEEVMRNILALSQELKTLSDLPQIKVDFEKQEGEELYFTVTVLRILKKQSQSLEEAFSNIPGDFRFILDRVQNVGYVRKRNPKESNVFRICIPKERSILRTNSAVNFYLARQKVVSIITEALGEVRDYNGGMILKQGELFSQLKHAFVNTDQQELLENFFFSLVPIEAQATSSLNTLKTLFKLFLESLSKEMVKRGSVFQKIKKQKNCVFVVLRAKDHSLEEIVNKELGQLKGTSKALIKAKVKFQGTLLQGFIYESDSLVEQKQFQSCISAAVKRWSSKIINLQELRLSFLDLPPSLDPRLGGDELSSTLMKMLFEGLTRVSHGSQPSLALAKSIDISKDRKRYTFKLRDAYWSNRMPLVAQDFEYAWKKILSPSFYTPFAYFFYPIKNAKAAKEGLMGLDEVGVRAKDDKTLIVDLEVPTPEFLEWTAHALYSPINQKVEELHPNWAQAGEDVYACNGPFKLRKALISGGYELIKNPDYWDQKTVKLNRIYIEKNNSETAFEKFKHEELDWIGRPFYRWEAWFKKGEEDVVFEGPFQVNWCVFNTQRFPFDNLKIRRAFSFAIDKNSLVEGLLDKLTPTNSPLPASHSGLGSQELLSGNKELARQYFEEGLKELGLTKQRFPLLTLITAGGNMGVLAKRLIKQWEKALGIICRVEEYEFHVLFSKLITGDYQFGMISWKSWINDPSYTLDVFRDRKNKVNFPKWEHPKYQEFLNRAKNELTPKKRLAWLMHAEELLIEEYPMLPLNNELYTYMRKKYLKNAFCSETGNIDFKNAVIAP